MSLRASATFARFMPRGFAIAIAQRFGTLDTLFRDSITYAA